VFDFGVGMVAPQRMTHNLDLAGPGFLCDRFVNPWVEIAKGLDIAVGQKITR
jgi:hypothetical protein